MTAVAETAASGVPVASPKKKFAKIPDKPDEKKYRDKIDEENRLIKGIRGEMGDIKKKIESMSAGKDEYQRKRDEIRRTLDVLSKQIDEFEVQRKDVLLLIEGKAREGREMKTKIQTMKKSFAYQSEEEIDKRIKEIEDEMMRSTISLREEKKLMNDIQLLKKEKPLVGKYAAMETTVNQDETIQLKARLDTIQQELKAVREKKRKEAEKQTRLATDRSNATNPVKDLYEEQRVLYHKIEECNQRIREHQVEHKAKFQEWSDQKAAMQASMDARHKSDAELKKVQYDIRVIERDLEKINEVAENPRLQLLQQTVDYLARLMKIDTSTVEQHTEESPTKVLDGEDGNVLLPKSQRCEEYFYAPTNKKKEKKSKKDKKRPLTHDMRTLADLKTLGVDPPLTTEDTEACFKVLQAERDKLETELESSMSERVGKREEFVNQLESLKADEIRLTKARGARKNEEKKADAAEGENGGDEE
eukprot:Platyproteum_vivax@DN1453_c0_g1_i1.p1